MKYYRRAVLYTLAWWLLGYGMAPGQGIWQGFEDASDALGARVEGMSFGVSWGDMDGDGDPDLAVSRHWHRDGLVLLRNEGGRFVDVSASIIPQTARFGDRHGATFFDADRDGRAEVLIAAGAAYGLGSDPNRVLDLQPDGSIVDVAAALALDYAACRARMFTAVDLDGFGAIDLICAAPPRPDGTHPTGFFVAHPAGPYPFLNVTHLTGVLLDTQYVQVLARAGRPALLLANGWPARVLDSRTPFADIDVGLPAATTFQDSRFADIDGDGDLDLVVIRRRERPGARQVTAEQLLFHFQGRTVEQGLRVFPVDPLQPLQIRLPDPRQSWLQADDVFLGSEGIHPTTPVTNMLLLSSRSEFHGIAPHEPGTMDALFVGWDPSLEAWELRMTGVAWQFLDGEIVQAGGIHRFEAIGFNNDPVLPRNQVFPQHAGRFLPALTATGLEDVVEGRSLAVADFDNDGDLDIYLVRTHAAGNLPDMLLLNRGSGWFDPAPSEHLPEASFEGRGDAVAAADFDGDGWIDLAVTNGWNGDPQPPGALHVLRNRGGFGHWLSVDLKAPGFGRHPIGSVVTVVAGGRKMVRAYDGSIHRESQDHDRLHFGLGAALVAERIEVLWPDGSMDVFMDVPADQRLCLERGHGAAFVEQVESREVPWIGVSTVTARGRRP